MVKLEERSIQGVFSAAIAALMSYLGVIAIPVVVLMAAMITDYITGMAAAWHNKKLSSKKGLSGIIKKISYLILVCVGMFVDWVIYYGIQAVGVDLGYTFFFGVLVTIWLIINELISILENLENIGVPMPAFLIQIVSKLKVTAENITNESESEKHD